MLRRALVLLALAGAALPACSAKRYALALVGGVCNLDGFDTKVGTLDVLSPTQNYCNTTVVARAYEVHLLRPNGGDVDVFVHSWNTDIPGVLLRDFRPVSARFDSYSDMYGVFERRAAAAGVAEPHYVRELSRAFTQQAALRLVADRERLRGAEYDLVVIARPDVILLKDVLLSAYDASGLFHDSGNEGTSDFIFVMNSAHARRWSELYDELDRFKDLATRPHARNAEGYGLYRQFAKDHVGAELRENDLVPGQDIEVYRKFFFGGNPTMVERAQNLWTFAGSLGNSV